MAYFIIFVLAVIVIIQHFNIKSLVATVESESPVLTRYIETCRWVCGVKVNALDVECYARHRKSDAMIAWEKVTGKNTLLISDFRDYVNDSNKQARNRENYITRLVEHVAILGMGINGKNHFRDMANDHYASLPDDLIQQIEAAEQALSESNEWPCGHGKSPDEERCEVCNGDGIWADVVEVSIAEALECMKTEFRNE